jgi:hypothetical protein
MRTLPWLPFLIILLSAPLRAPAAEEAWVEPMRKVHARFRGKPGTFAHFGDSITVSRAFWSPLAHEPKGMDAATAKALTTVREYQLPDCWSKWKGPEFGNEGGMTVRWAHENVDRWLKKLNPETVLIMFGTNDLGQLEEKEYTEKTREVVRRCLDNGSVVLLSTIPPRSGLLDKSRRFAEAVRGVGRELKVPVVDYFAEVLRRRPDDWDGSLAKFKGVPGDEYQVPTLISRDGVHPSYPRMFQSFDEEGLRSNGYLLRSYLVLRAYAGVINKVLDRDGIARLRKAVTFYASFDEEVRGDAGGGELTLSTRSNHETEKGKFVYEKGFNGTLFRVARGKGIAGGALEATDVLPRNGRVYFPAKGNIAYRPGGWGGAVSVWVNTDPNRLLKTAFCDPIQITQKGANNGGLWFDFNNAKPRDLRHGAFPAIAEGQTGIKEEDAKAPIVRVPGIDWKAGDWHHVVLNWRNFDTGKLDAVSALYIDGKLIGEIEDQPLAMGWELNKTGIYVAVNYIGLLDELAVFGRPLTAGEIERLHREAAVLGPLKSGAKPAAMPDEVRKGLREFYRRTARRDGSFQPGIDPEYLGMSDCAYSDLAAVTYAVTIHKTLGWKLPHEEKTAEFLMQRQKPDGSFLNVAGTVDPASAEGRVYNTTQGLVALRALGLRPQYNPLAVFKEIAKQDADKLPAYSTSFFPLAYLAYGQPIPPDVDRRIRATMVQAEDGYLNNHIAATFHAAHYHRLIGEPTPKAQKMLERILREQKPDGSWLLNLPSRDRHATFDAVFTLRQLGHERTDCRAAIQRAARWVLSCRNADGGFGHFPGSTSDADAVYFHVGTLVMAGFLPPAEPPPKDGHLLSWGHMMPLRDVEHYTNPKR